MSIPSLNLRPWNDKGPFVGPHHLPKSWGKKPKITTKVALLITKVISLFQIDENENKAVQIKKKKPLKERLAEKEEQRKRELEEKKRKVRYLFHRLWNNVTQNITQTRCDPFRQIAKK